MLEFKHLVTRAAVRLHPEGAHAIQINVGIQTPRDRAAVRLHPEGAHDPNQCRNSNTSRVARRFSCGMTNCRRNSNIDLKRPPPLLDAPGRAREPALSRSQRVVTREERVARRSHPEGVPRSKSMLEFKPFATRAAVRSQPEGDHEIRINVGIQTPRESRGGSHAG